jgi:hypothetical protein
MMADREPLPARSVGGGQLLRAGDGSRSGGVAKMRRQPFGALEAQSVVGSASL